MSRIISAAILFVPIAFLHAAAPKDELLTKTYDMADLLYKPDTTKSGYDSIDEIVKEIITNVNPHSWQTKADGGNRIFEVNGRRLEISAAQNDHDEIKKLLEALRRQHDMAVEVKTRFISVDPKWFEKEIRPVLNRKPKGDYDEAWQEAANAALDALKEKGEAVQSNFVRLGNNREIAIASLRQANTFDRSNGLKVWDIEFTGATYRAKTIVSRDRRFVTLKIDETIRERDGVPKGDTPAPIKEKKSLTTVRIADGWFHILVVPYTPKTIADRGRILILLIEPRIWIEAEEKERRGKKDDG